MTGDVSEEVGGGASRNLALSPPVQSAHGVPRTFWETVGGQARPLLLMGKGERN